MQTTAQKLAKLKTLRDQAGPNVYERVKLACEVRDDEEWVATIGGPDQADEHLADEFLGDLCGAVSFGDLYRIFQAVPDAGEWKTHKWNLRRLYALMKERTPKPEREITERRRATVKDLEEAQEAVKQAEYAAQAARKEADVLREENERLKEKIARLEGRIEEMERQASLRRAS